MYLYEPFYDYTNYNNVYTYFKYIVMFPVVILRVVVVLLDVLVLYIFALLDIRSVFILKTFCKILNFAFGFHNINVINKKYFDNRINKNVVIVYNHSTLLDAYIICGCITPGSCAIYYKYVQSIKLLCDYSQALIVNDDKYGSSNSVNIKEYVDCHKRTLVIAPEGVVSTGKYLLNFSTGAFITQSPILPVVLKYPNRVNMSWCCNHSVLFKLYTILAQFHNNATVELLPLQYIQPDETPRQFADRVRTLMSEQSGIPMLNFNGRDKSKAYREYLKK